jgi:hypothetical protein
MKVFMLVEANNICKRVSLLFYVRLGQAPQTRGPRAACGPRGGPMRPSINFLKSRKDEKMTF